MKYKNDGKQLILLKVSDPYAGDDRSGLPKIEKFDMRVLRGNTIYNYKNCYIKSMSTQAPELIFDRCGFNQANPGPQDAEITIGADYFTCDYANHTEIQDFKRLFDLGINSIVEEKQDKKQEPKVIEKIVEKEVVKVEYVSVVVVPPTYKEIITEKYDFYKKLL